MLSAEEVSKWLQREESQAPDGGLFRAHFEHLPGPAYIWRRSGDDFELIAHNRAALGVADGDVRDLLGSRAGDLFEDRPDIVESIHECANTQSIMVQETDVTFVSGVTRRMLMTRIPLSADIVVGHMEDVTDRRAFENMLQASERRFRALFKTHPDLVFRMDVQGKYLDAHVPDGTTLPLKLEPEEIVGRSIADLFGPEAAARHRRYAREAIRTGDTQILEYDVSIGDGEIQVESRVVKSGDDEVVVNIRDITKRVELEQAILDAQEGERIRLGAALESHRARLRQCAARLEAAADAPSGEAGGSPVADALEALTAAMREVDELMGDFAPLPEGTPVVTALRILVSRSEQSLGVSCRLTHSGSIPDMLPQAADLYRVAQEAIGNAVRHGRAKHVEMICGTINNQFVLSVVDDAEGFSWAEDESGGYGMRVMRYLAKGLGGKLTRSRRACGGTMVTCSCPVDGASSVTARLRALSR